MLSDKSNKATQNKNIKRANFLLFTLSSRVRQDAYQPLLLACSVRQEGKIRGIRLGMKEARLSLLLICLCTQEAERFLATVISISLHQPQLCKHITKMQQQQKKVSRNILKKIMQGFYWENYTTLLKKLRKL